MVLELVFNTKLHRGHLTRKFFYVDDSYLEFNEDRILDFYQSHMGIFNPSSLARYIFGGSSPGVILKLRSCMPLYEKYFRATELIHKMAIDEYERMAIVALCIYRRSNLNTQTSKRRRFSRLYKWAAQSKNAADDGQNVQRIKSILRQHF